MQKTHQGGIKVFNLKPGAVETLARTGFAPEEGTPPDFYSGKEYLSFIQKMKSHSSSGKDEVEELLQWFELEPHKKVREYSKGMRRRLTLAQALIGKPELLILDEPLNGLDPLIIVKLRDWLNSRKSERTCLIYSSHILSEVEKVCTRAIILKEGQIVLDQSIASIVSEHGSVEAAFTKKANHP